MTFRRLVCWVRRHHYMVGAQAATEGVTVISLLRCVRCGHELVNHHDGQGWTVR